MFGDKFFVLWPAKFADGLPAPLWSHRQRDIFDCRAGIKISLTTNLFHRIPHKSEIGLNTELDC